LSLHIPISHFPFLLSLRPGDITSPASSDRFSAEQLLRHFCCCQAIILSFPHAVSPHTSVKLHGIEPLSTAYWNVNLVLIESRFALIFAVACNDGLARCGDFIHSLIFSFHFILLFNFISFACLATRTRTRFSPLVPIASIGLSVGMLGRCVLLAFRLRLDSRSRPMTDLTIFRFDRALHLRPRCRRLPQERVQLWPLDWKPHLGSPRLESAVMG
jgi:hypothetical protein